MWWVGQFLSLVQSLDACSNYRVWTDMHVRATRSLNWLAINCVYLIALQFSRLIKIGVAGGISPAVFLGIPGLTAEGSCQDAPFLQSEANSISNPYIVTCLTREEAAWRKLQANLSDFCDIFCIIPNADVPLFCWILNYATWSTRQDSNLRCKSFGVNEVRSPLLVTRRKSTTLIMCTWIGGYKDLFCCLCRKWLEWTDSNCRMHVYQTCVFTAFTTLQ